MNVEVFDMMGRMQLNRKAEEQNVVANSPPINNLPPFVLTPMLTARNCKHLR